MTTDKRNEKEMCPAMRNTRIEWSTSEYLLAKLMRFIIYNMILFTEEFLIVRFAIRAQRFLWHFFFGASF